MPGETLERAPHRNSLRISSGELGDRAITAQLTDDATRGSKVVFNVGHGTELYQRNFETQPPKPLKKALIAKKFGIPHNGPMRPDSPEAMARRLKILRFSISGDNQTDFAKKLRISVQRWNNFERMSPLSRPIADLLLEKFPGITYEWLRSGKVDAVPFKLRMELEEAERALDELASANGTTRGR